MQTKYQTRLAKIFIIISLLIPFINIEVLFKEYIPKNFQLFYYIWDTALLPKYLVLIILLSAFLIILLFNWSKIKIPKTFFKQAIFHIYFIIIILSFISIFSAIIPYQSLAVSLNNFSFFIYFVIGSIIISQYHKSYIFLSKAVVIFGLSISVLGFYQIFTLIDIDNFNRDFTYQITTLFANRNLFSQILLLSFPFTLWIIIFTKNYWRLVATLSLISELILITFLMSRAVWLAFIISAFISIIILLANQRTLNYQRIKIKKLFIIIGAITIIILSTLYTYSKLESRKSILNHISSNLASANERMALWSTSTRMITDNTISGVGAGNWGINVRKYSIQEIRGHEHMHYFNFIRPHNYYLQIASENGIPALVLYIILIFISIRYLLQIIKQSKDQPKKFFALLMLFAIISYLIISFFSFPNERISHQIYFGLILIITTTLNFKNKKEENNSFIKNPKIIIITSIIILSISAIITIQKLKGETNARIAIEYKKQSKPKLALKYLSKAESHFFKTDNNLTPIPYHKATAWFMLGDLQKAESEYKKALIISPFDIYSMNDLASVYEMQAKHKKAKHYYNEVLRYAKDFDESLINMAIVYFNEGKIDSAYNFIQRCDSNTTNKKYNRTLGVILMEIKARKKTLQ